MTIKMQFNQLVDLAPLQGGKPLAIATRVKEALSRRYFATVEEFSFHNGSYTWVVKGFNQHLYEQIYMSIRTDERSVEVSWDAFVPNESQGVKKNRRRHHSGCRVRNAEGGITPLSATSVAQSYAGFTPTLQKKGDNMMTNDEMFKKHGVTWDETIVCCVLPTIGLVVMMAGLIYDLIASLVR